MGNWAIDTGDGNQITTGLQDHEARCVAQDAADRLGESVYLYEVGSDDEAEEIKPSEVK